MDFKKAKKILHRHSIALHKTVKHCNGTMLIKDPDTKKFKLQICVEKESLEHKKLKKMKAGKVLRSDDKKATDDELEVDFLVVGKIEANLVRTSKWFPTPGAPGGVSIGHKDITAGTLGCSVFDGCDRFILSCSHILADCNDGVAGDAIYQPGPFDGGTAADKIGELHSYVEIDFWVSPEEVGCNTVDAALCKPTVDSYITNALIEDDCSTEYFPDGLGDWEDTFDAVNLVKMSGRTSGVITGYILGYGNFWVDYGESRFAYMTCQIATTYMAAGGDSGSLLIDNVTKKAIGLCFAGSDSFTLFNDLRYVAEAFGITFYPVKGVSLMHEGGKLVAETTGEDVKLIIATPAGCAACPCNPAECDVVGCREYTPKHIAVTLSGVQLYTGCCDFVGGDCSDIYPEPASHKYTINVNKTYILEQDPANRCKWVLDVGELVGGICYSLDECTGDTDPMIWPSENGLTFTTSGSEGQGVLEVVFGGHNVIIGRGDTSGCVETTLNNDDQANTDCNNIFSKGSATVVGLGGST